jgi:CelD/BcsL family acetyltransferase involved in cellulose biosynthesis
MQVQEIESIDEFERLRPAWDDVFAADAHASVFMSWAWLRGWFDVTPHPWTVLAAREDERSPWLGFLPVSFRGSRSALRIDHVRELHMAGEPAADCTGFVCRDGAERTVIPALADYVVRELPWERLRFEEVHDPRMALFTERLTGEASVLQQQGTPCPRMNLPATWEAFMASLSYSTRQSLRKRIKKAEREFRITHLDGRNDEMMIDALIEMALRRMREQPDPHTWRLHSMLRRCAMAGSAWMVMLWRDGTPVAGAGALIDRKESSLGLYVTAFDEGFADYSPGRVATALAIRGAIGMGMKVFDFLRGEEPYKLQFGAVSRHNRIVLAERPTLQTALRKGLSGLRERLRI